MKYQTCRGGKAAGSPASNLQRELDSSRLLALRIKMNFRLLTVSRLSWKKCVGVNDNWSIFECLLIESLS